MLKYLIFDADHTILEFDDDEKRAFYLTFKQYGVEYSPDQLQKCRDFSYVGWAELGLNDIHKEEIQREYHTLYRKYVYDMFIILAKQIGFPDKAKEMAEVFFTHFKLGGHPIGNSVAVLSQLSATYKICVATNGLQEVQSGRLTPFADSVYKIFISERLGHIKPEEEFFRLMLCELNATPDECLMIGDSLSSDMAGANGCGMKCCWLNRFSIANKKNIPVDYEVKQVDELLSIL